MTLKKFMLLLMSLILNACLHTEKPEPSEVKLMIQDEIQYADWVKREKSIDWKDLRKARDMTAQYLADYPRSAHAQYIAAVMAGDYSELLSAHEEQKIKESAVFALFPLLERIGEFRPYMRAVLRNEFYYHSNRFLNQYLLGCEELTSGNKASGNFSIGVGGSEHAFQLLKDGRVTEAKYFAGKAVKAWEDHAVLSPKWSYPYPYFYIQAALIHGEKDKAFRELERIHAKDEYRLKKPIYDKYDLRFKLIEKALSANG
jgi:hypothetical protein